MQLDQTDEIELVVEKRQRLVDRHPRGDAAEYTKALLLWWRINHPAAPTWGHAARIVFSMTCTSAASERVFSMVNDMFGPERATSLADQLQTAVMLRYNKRQVG